MTAGGAGSRGNHLYILAFDHRGSFEKDLFRVTGVVDEPTRLAIADAKAVIYAGFQEALRLGVPRENAGVLVDEAYGAEVARRARADGVTLAMPVEKSGQDAFELEYGDDFAAHVERFNPDLVKVLVRYNPDGDPAVNVQVPRLARLSAWLADKGRHFLFELLVPPTDAQLATVQGDRSRYDSDLRPALEVRAIQQLQDAGVEPGTWKIEGFDRPEACAEVLSVARREGRDDVRCIVLGRGGDEASVERWLVAGATAGFAGLAIGRTIWEEPLRAMLSGSTDRPEATRQIAAAYHRVVQVYQEAAAAR